MKHDTGFTLIELMVTVALAAILLTVAIPSFQDLITSNRLTTQANELVTALNLARSEAVKRGTTVSIKSSAGTDWAQGWTVFIDEDGDGDVDAGEELRVFGSATGNTLTGTVGTLAYASTGFLSGPAATFTLCHPGESKGRQVSVSSTGRVSMSSDYTGC